MAKSGPTLDIRTAVVSSEQTIWAMHAGGGRKFAQQFYAESRIFLDLPGASLTNKVLADISSVRRTLRMSAEVVTYHNALRRGEKPANPSRRIADYSDAPGRKEGSGINARVGNILTVFRLMKKGDLVFVPITMQGVSHIISGEIASDFSPTDEIQSPLYPRETIPFRRVRWLSDPIPRSTLDGEVSKRLSNPHAVIEMPALYRRSAMAHVYRNVVVDGASETRILGQRYDGKRIKDLVEAIKFLDDNIALTGKVSKDGTVAAAPGSIARIPSIDYAEFLDDFALEFHSPGDFRIAMKAVRAAVVVGLVALLAGDVPKADLEKVQVVNTRAPQDVTVTPQVEEQIRDLIKGLNPEQFKKLREEAKRATQNIGLNTDSEVRK